MTRTDDRPRAVGIASGLLVATALVAVAGAAGPGRAPALMTAVSAAVAALAVRSRRSAGVAAGAAVTVAMAVVWTAVEATSRHVLDPWVAAPAVLAGLLLVRADTRRYLAGD